jgi:hypothetical protein
VTRTPSPLVEPRRRKLHVHAFRMLESSADAADAMRKRAKVA